MAAAGPASGAPAFAPATRKRLTSLDAFRGLDILAMVFVNAIAGMKAIPFFLRHAAADQDTFTLTDVVFPGFLFIMGVSIPLALARRKADGAKTLPILGHVVVRTLALLFLGVLLVNEGRFSAPATGMSRDLWYLLATLAVLALWAAVPKGLAPPKRRLRLGLKAAAAVLLAALVVVFRGQDPGGPATWLQTSWWGILGMIGWCYLAGSLLYLASRGNRTVLAGAIGLAAALFVGSRHGALDFLGPVTGFIDVGSLFGSHTAIVAAGMLAGTLFLPGTDVAAPRGRLRFLGVLGAGLLAAGFILRPLHGFSKIHGTESYCLAAAGISTLVLLVLYLGSDVLKGGGAVAFLLPAGRNPLLAYLLPGLIMNASALLGGLVRFDLDRVLWPLAGAGGIGGMLNAAVMTAIVLLLTSALTRAGLVLKL